MDRFYELFVEDLGYNKRVLGTYNGALYLASGDYIQRSLDNGTTLSTLSRAFVGGLYWGVHSGFVSRNGVIILCAANAGIYKLITSNDQGATWNIALDLPNGFGLSHSFCDDSQGNIYYGEYDGSAEQKDISNIWKSTDNGVTFQVVYQFTGNEVRHVHTLRNDPYTDYIWVGTGDGMTKNKIGYSSDGGVTFTFLEPTNIPLYLEKQLLRTVSFIFTEDYVHWAADFYPGMFLRYERSTGILEELNAFESGPAYYGSKWVINGDNVMLFALHSPTDATIYLCHNEEFWYQAASFKILTDGMVRISGVTDAQRGYIFAQIANAISQDGVEWSGAGNVVRFSVIEKEVEYKRSKVDFKVIRDGNKTLNF